ncbi:hypothetical protein [Niastella yeongjuensis]|nr:hypothetical protein [Niastella yeongjuensis]SEP38197.1 hypothetical protein SAMN05660816_05602 [Niastella yeongjuensis]
MDFHKAFKPDLRLLIGSLVTTTGTYVLTALHHAYGAWLYKTPWRLHILFHGLIILLITGAFLFLYEWLKKKVFLFLYLVTAGLFFGGLIGLYEGLYNHLLKNILYFGGLSPTSMRWFYPASLYELPNDWLFEITGALQAFIGALQLYYTVKLFRDINLASPPKSIISFNNRHQETDHAAE